MDPMKMQQVPAPPQQYVSQGKSVNTTAMKKVLPGILAFLMFAFNIVFLGGVAAAQARCKDLSNPWYGNDAGLGLVGEYNTRLAKADNQPVTANQGMSYESQCRYEYSFDWWIVFFQLISLAIAVAVAFAPKLRRFSISICLWLAACTALLMYLCSKYNMQIMYLKIARDSASRAWGAISNPTGTMQSVYNGVQDDAKSLQMSTQAAFAGTIVLSILNLIYLFIAPDTHGLAPELSLPQRAAAQAYPPQMAGAQPNMSYSAPPPAGVAMSQEMPPGYAPQVINTQPVYVDNAARVQAINTQPVYVDNAARVQAINTQPVYVDNAARVQAINTQPVYVDNAARV